MILAKRRTGAPLSDAEHQERRDAAAARWQAVKAGASLAGAAAGAAGVRAGFRAQAAQARAKVKQAYGQTVGAEVARNRRKEALIRLNALRAQAHVRENWPVPAMRAALYQDKRDAQRRINAQSLKAADPAHRGGDALSLSASLFGFDDDNAAEIDKSLQETSAPVLDVAALHDKTVAERRIDQLSGARASKRVRRTGYDFQRGPSERMQVISRELRPSKVAAARKIEQANAANPDKPRKIPRSWYRTTKKLVPVKAYSGTVEAGKTTVPGTHDRDELRAMRRNLVHRITTLETKHAAKQAAAHAAAMTEAKPIFRSSAAAALRWLPNRRVRTLAIGAGAVAGGLAGLFATHGVHHVSEQLSKAADDTTGDLSDTSEHLSDAVNDAEPKLAAALANVFRQWKDDATAKLRGPRESTLYSTMLTDLDHATRPLDPVLRAGTDAPVQVTVPDDDGKSRVITVTMGARGPDVENYIRDYRQNRIVQLATEQKEAIRDLLINAAQQGASPDTMAKQIRQTIGLTANQAQMVLNYRRELEELNPAALKRGLRDKRMDRTIDRAINDAGTLTPRQIDAAVDAYHRKFLAYRAMTIARTEGVGAANNAHIATMRAWLAQNPGYTVVKTWNAKLDERTRPDHKDLHGQSVIGIDTPFTCTSGESIRWPHDPDAAAKEVINCRCFPQLRIVPRARAARMGTRAVRPFAEEITS